MNYIGKQKSGVIKIKEVGNVNRIARREERQHI